MVRSHVPSVTSNLFMVTLKARKSQGRGSGGSLYCNLRRLCIRTVEVTISIAHDSYRMSARTTVHRDPTLLRSQQRRIMEGQMGGSPKASSTASGRGNQPAGETQNTMIRHEKLYDHLDGNHRIEEIAGATSARKFIMQPQLLRQEAFTRREGEKLTTSTRETTYLWQSSQRSLRVAKPYTM